MGSAIDKFKAAALRLAEIEGLARSYQGLPDRLAADVERVPVWRRDYYSSTEASEPAVAAVIAGKKAAKESERQRGEQERDAQLRKLGLELEALRNILPALAAKASIELGAIARSYMGGANG